MDKQTYEQRTCRVKGMGCEGCADTVRQALEQIKGVDEAVVSLENETA